MYPADKELLILIGNILIGVGIFAVVFYTTQMLKGVF